MAYDFSGLTNTQHRVLCFQGWHPGDGFPRPRRSTLEELERRNLVTVIPAGAGRKDFVRVEVSIAVHLAWCNEMAIGCKDA